MRVRPGWPVVGLVRCVSTSASLVGVEAVIFMMPITYTYLQKLTLCMRVSQIRASIASTASTALAHPATNFIINNKYIAAAGFCYRDVCTAGNATAVSQHQYAAAASKQSASASGMQFSYSVAQDLSGVIFYSGIQ